MNIRNKFKKIKEHIIENRYYYMLLAHDFILCLFVGVGLIFEQFHQRHRILFYNFDDKGTGILVMLGIIWLITVGFLLYAAQCGQGKTVGLNILDVIRMELGKGMIYGSAFIIAIKLFIYVWVYVNEKRWLLFFLIIEGILALCLICVFLICITSRGETSRLIRKQMKHSFEKSITIKEKEALCLNFLRMAKMMNYEDNEECDELIECIVQYTESIGDVELYMGSEEYELQNKEELLVQITTLKKLADNLYAATKGGKLLEHIMQQCVEKLSKRKVNYFKIYMLIQGLLVRDAYALQTQQITNILAVMSVDAEKVRDCIICYLHYLEEKTTEKVWAEEMKKEFLAGQNYKPWNYNKVLYIETVKYEKRMQNK